MSKKRKRRRLRNPLRRIDFTDPMIRILTGLLVTITGGIVLNGCFNIFSGNVTIALDAAFGGEYSGAVGVKKESEVCEKFVEELEVLLAEDSRFTVVRTNDPGESMTITERCEIADRDDADLILSIHAMGNPDVSKSGMQVFANIPSSKQNEASLKAAHAIAGAFESEDWKPTVNYMYYEPVDTKNEVYALKIVEESDNQKYELETWEMMEQSRIPVVLVNALYVTNQADVDRWTGASGYKQAAELYYRALKKAYGFDDE